MRQLYLSLVKNLNILLLLWIAISHGQTCHNSSSTTSETAGPLYVFYQQPRYPRDCYEVLYQCPKINSSGVYIIKPIGYPDAFEVYCDNDKDGGGWMVFHRRIDGTIHFHRSWKEYKNGFGFVSNEFWIGLERLSFLTNQKKYEIRIDMETDAGSSFHIQYSGFRISDEHSYFKLNYVGQYNGTGDDIIVDCPPNTVYGNCNYQATCEDPENLLGCQSTSSKEEKCICKASFLKKGGRCVPPNECDCFMEGERVVPSNQTLVNVACTSRCRCQSNVLICDDNYKCSTDASCEERNGIRQCYCNDGYTGDGENCKAVTPSDCADIYHAGITDSGVYTIKPTDWPGAPFEVYCSMTDGGGWTVFQRRVDGSQDFYLGWNMYKDGFGSPQHEHWLGNEKLYYMTNNKNYHLRIDLVDRDHSPYYANYNLFRISDENDKYRLVGLGSLTGNAGWDALYHHRNDSFSTHDSDNDDTSSYNCAERHHGAWWYDFRISFECETREGFCDWWRGGDGCGVCADSNLNGEYDSSTPGTSLHWNYLPGYDCNIIYTEMKIKPV